MSPPSQDRSVPDSDLTARILAALNHPIRIKILEALAEEPSSASNLAKQFCLAVGLTSYHLCKILFDQLDLVRVVERHQRRGVEERVFALKPEAFVGLVLLRIAKAAETPGALGLYTPIAINEEGQREVASAVTEFADRVEEIAARGAP